MLFPGWINYFNLWPFPYDVPKVQRPPPWSHIIQRSAYFLSSIQSPIWWYSSNHCFREILSRLVHNDLWIVSDGVLFMYSDCLNQISICVGPKTAYTKTFSKRGTEFIQAKTWVYESSPSQEAAFKYILEMHHAKCVNALAKLKHSSRQLP